LNATIASGPEAIIKEDWVQAKRHVHAVLRVQTGLTLYDVLVARPEEIHEQRWLEEVYRDIELERARLAKHDLPPTPVEAGYQIESIRSCVIILINGEASLIGLRLPFHEVKSRAIEFCMKLEQAGKISRKDHFQGLLVSIASDIRQKHHLRKMQRQNLAAMTKAFEDMSEKKAHFTESIQRYHEFIDSSMANLQKGWVIPWGGGQRGRMLMIGCRKKKPVFLSKQFRHQRHEAKMGKKAQFGTYKYTATDLYEKGEQLGHVAYVVVLTVNVRS
jgi:Ras GTPase-activating-like protein IQGAP2/3